MPTLMKFYPGDQAAGLFLIVMAGAAVLSSAGWAISRTFRRKPALRHLVLYWALIACLALPFLAYFSAASGITLFSLSILPAEHAAVDTMPTQIEPEPVETSVQTRIDRPSAVAASVERPAESQPTNFSRHTAEPSPSPPESNPEIKLGVESTVPSAAPESASSPSGMQPDARESDGRAPTLTQGRRVAGGILLAWAVGASLMLARLVRTYRQVEGLRRSSRALQNGSHHLLLQEVAAKLGMHRVPLLLVSTRAVTPMAVGLRRPAVIVPERLLGAISDHELRDVILHEVAHIRRRDPLTVLLQGLAGVLYWPVVPVHALNRGLQRSREELCDNIVLASRDAIGYGETLLHVAQLLVDARLVSAAVGMLHWRGKLEHRVAGLLDPARSRATKPSRALALVVIVSFLTFTTMASATRLLTETQAAANGATFTQASADVEPASPAATGVDQQVAPGTHDAVDIVNPAQNVDSHFSGRVTGTDGKPVIGARLFAVPQSRNFYGSTRHSVLRPEDGPLQMRAETDADGRFEFDAPDMVFTDIDGLPSRRWCLLIATAVGHGPDWITIPGRDLSSDRPKPGKLTDLALQLVPDDVPIHGRLLGPDRRPLAGARVRLTHLRMPWKRNLDEHLQLEKKRSRFDNGPQYERSLHRPDLVPGLVAETQSDADGRFTLSGLGRDRLANLFVTAPSVVDTALEVMTREGPDEPIVLGDSRPLPPTLTPQIIRGAGFTVELKRGLTITGLVRDRDTHAPIAGMWVTRRHNPLTDSSFGADVQVTDEKGRFTISGLKPELVNWKKQHRDVTAIPQPGGQFLMAKGFVEPDATVVIDCPRGIKYRLKLVDEQGNPVEANVEYWPVGPNPHLPELIEAFAHSSMPIMNRAARQADGTYEGFVLPGPGAVLVKTPGQRYRPAHVDPKAFFAPGRTDWTAPGESHWYGTHDTLSIQPGWHNQHDYAAIVLVNPQPNSNALELSATVVKDKPRRVTLIDADGKPVVGVQAKGLRYHPDTEPILRAPSFYLTGLHPQRERRLTFIQKDRQLISTLVARGDGETPYIVRMHATWGTVAGRIVDEHGNPLPIRKPESDYKSPPIVSMQGDGELGAGTRASVETDREGRFRIDKLIPGQSYSGKIAGQKEKLFEKLVLRAGEVRDLGDIRTQVSYGPDYRRPTAEDQQATANIPAEAWGEPVNGLRVAIALRSPPVYEEYHTLGYDIVAENVSDQDIRFGAAEHYEYGYRKLALVDVDGKQVPRQQGTQPTWVESVPNIRLWLKPKERAIISSCTTRLVRLNEAGRPIPAPKQRPYYHLFPVKPGRYSVSAAVELGFGMELPDPAAPPQKTQFAAKGEWTGKLQTGVVTVSLFEDADK